MMFLLMLLWLLLCWGLRFEVLLFVCEVWVCVGVMSVNLGFGFDSFGLVLVVFDDFVVCMCDELGVVFEVIGEGVDDLGGVGEEYFVVCVVCYVFDFVGEF